MHYDVIVHCIIMLILWFFQSILTSRDNLGLDSYVFNGNSFVNSAGLRI